MTCNANVKKQVKQTNHTLWKCKIKQSGWRLPTKELNGSENNEQPIQNTSTRDTQAAWEKDKYQK